MTRSLGQFLFCLSLLSAIPVGAQVIIEDMITTDTVELFVEQSGERKSPRLAMLANVLLPGLGHKYVGKENGAFSYLAVEAFLVTGIIYYKRKASRLFADSRSYAVSHAQVEVGMGAGKPYWEHVGRFMDTGDYNNVMVMARSPDDKYVERELYWYWDDQTYKDEYNTIRKRARRFEVIGSFLLGGLVLNRLVSYIDVRIATKYRGVRSARARIRVEPVLSVAGGGATGMILNGTF